VSIWKNHLSNGRVSYSQPSKGGELKESSICFSCHVDPHLSRPILNHPKCRSTSRSGRQRRQHGTRLF